MSRSPDPKKPAVWRGRFDRFSTSGLSVARFCVRERVSVASFYHWRKKLGAQAARKPPRPWSSMRGAAFQPVTVVPGARGVFIELPGGTRIEVRAEDLAAVRAVVAEVARSDRSPEGESSASRRVPGTEERSGAASC